MDFVLICFGLHQSLALRLHLSNRSLAQL